MKCNIESEMTFRLRLLLYPVITGLYLASIKLTFQLTWYRNMTVLINIHLVTVIETNKNSEAMAVICWEYIHYNRHIHINENSCVQYEMKCKYEILIKNAITTNIHDSLDKMR